MSGEPLPPTLATLNELKERLPQLPGWQVRAELLALDRSMRVFKGNAAELSRYLGEHERVPAVLELWDVNNRDAFDRFLDEVDRLLHNFVASAASLRDHTRRLRDKLLREDPGDELAAEYQTRVDELFKSSPAVQFIQGVRNYALHRRLPIARGSLSIAPHPGRSVAEGASFESQIMLDRSDLLEWPNWNRVAMEYIDAAEGDVPIDEAIEKCVQAVTAFHDWFKEAILGRHRADLAALEVAEADLVRLQRQAFGPPLDETDLADAT
jgi:hypothetical protein